MVGNFQESQVAFIHFLGATLCFGLGTVYLWTQVNTDPCSPPCDPLTWAFSLLKAPQ